MENGIKNIIIVGGGTAGWMSAAYLNRALSNGSGKACSITLIESSDIGTIGVGEATIPTLPLTFRFLGMDEEDWLVKCNSSFKLAVKFVHWSGLPGRDYYYHPFDTLEQVRGLSLAQYWLKRRQRGDPAPFDFSCFRSVRLCEARRAPKAGSEQHYQGKAIYAYHLDAGLLAEYLKHLAKDRGVRHVVDNVTGVALDEAGHISHLRTEKSGDLHGDLFIDCSGFRGLLINEALKEPFISFSDSLFCDRAIAIPTPTDKSDGINPYTTATALSAGWVWNTPLFGRNGNGYVYSSGFVSPEDAERELREFLGPRSVGVPARHLKMRVGRTRNAWVKNCVSIGLASGFIEPLESTGIFLIEDGLYNLMHNFPSKRFEESLIAKYNSIMKSRYEGIRDFIVLHYCITNREDTPFWKENKYHPAIPSTLKDKLELWETVLPAHESVDIGPRFADASYNAIVLGMGRLPKRTVPIMSFRDDEEAEDVFRAVREDGDRLSALLPDHYEYLERLRREEFRALMNYLRSPALAVAK